MSQAMKVGKEVAQVYNRLDDKTLDAVSAAIVDGFGNLVDTLRPFFEFEKKQISRASNVAMTHIRKTGKKVIQIIYGKSGSRSYKIANKEYKVDETKMRSVLKEIGKSFAGKWVEMAKDDRDSSTQKRSSGAKSAHKVTKKHHIHRKNNQSQQQNKNQWNQSQNSQKTVQHDQ